MHLVPYVTPAVPGRARPLTDRCTCERQVNAPAAQECTDMVSQICRQSIAQRVRPWHNISVPAMQLAILWHQASSQTPVMIALQQAHIPALDINLVL